jgi:hypothetical protein
VPPGGVWTTCRHMQSPRELQQLNNWSVKAEIQITARQSHVENNRKTNTHLSIAVAGEAMPTRGSEPKFVPLGFHCFVGDLRGLPTAIAKHPLGGEVEAPLSHRPTYCFTTLWADSVGF